MTQQQSCTSSNNAPGTRSIRFVVAARRPSGLFLVEDFSTAGRAEIAIQSCMDRAPLEVVCSEVWRASNGNVREWQHKQVRVLVDVVDPTAGFIGGDDVDAVPAMLNLFTGEIRLDNPRQGHPLLNWSDTGVCISFHGSQYHARVQTDNLPPDIADHDIVGFIREHGYTVTVDLASLYTADGDAGKSQVTVQDTEYEVLPTFDDTCRPF